MTISDIERKETQKLLKLKAAKEKILLSVDETVLLIGISKPTLYRYLKNKEDFPKPFKTAD